MIGPRLRIVVPRALALSGALLLACARDPEEGASAAIEGEPSEAVLAYFEAVAGHDCAALESVVAEGAARALAEHGCEQTIAEFEKHDARLDGIESVLVDGRDPSLHLVRTQMRESGRSKLVVIGVRQVEGRWRVVRI
jgi:hypothetical protein